MHSSENKKDNSNKESNYEVSLNKMNDLKINEATGSTELSSGACALPEPSEDVRSLLEIFPEYSQTFIEVIIYFLFVYLILCFANIEF